MLWSNEPPAVIGFPEQGGKTRSRIETGPAQPIDRAVTADQSCRLAVADQRIVFDSQRHCIFARRIAPSIAGVMRLIEPRLFRLAVLGALLRRELGTRLRAHAQTLTMAAPFLFGPMSLGRLLLCGRRQRDSGLSREQQEGQRLLEVKPHDAVGVAQITDREVLPDVQIEITAACGEHEGARDGW